MRRPIFIVLISMLACTFSLFCEASASEHALVTELRQITGKQVDIVNHPTTGKAKFLAIADGYSVTASPVMRKGIVEGNEGRAAAFLQRYGALFGVDDPGKQLTIKKSVADKERHFVRYQQNFEGLPVIGGELIVHLHNDNISSVSGKASHVVTLATEPAILPETAREIALNLVTKRYPYASGPLKSTEPELSVYNPAIMGHAMDTNSLVWKIEVKAVDIAPVNVFVLVDALHGTVVLDFNQIDYAKSRKVYDKGSIRSDSLPGTDLQRTELSASSSITEVNTVFNYLGDTHDFFKNNHGRDSVDNLGMELVATTRFCSTDTAEACPWNNAYWSSDYNQMVCGEGECTDDTVGHEIAHGVIGSTANLFYYMQSGAINESLADVWGEFIDLVNGKGNDDPSQRWLFSEDSAAGGLRNMSNPPVFGDPDRMGSSYYFCGVNDNGGVHFNSGVNNKAAFLMTDGGTFNGRTVNGLGIIKTAKIYYEALTKLLVSASDYEDLYYALKTACSNLTSTGVTSSADCLAVANALDAVEMNQQPFYCSAPEAPVCAMGQTPVNSFFDDFESGSSNWLLTVMQGPDPWSSETGLVNFLPYATSGTGHLWGVNNSSISDSYVRTTSAITVPSGAFLHFKHSYDFELYYDGGVVEYSTNGGSTWSDAGPLFTTNGYSHTLNSSGTNPLKGRNAFSGLSNGYISSRLNLASLAGANVFFRFRIGTDSSYGSDGWFIDDVRLYACSGGTTYTVTPSVGANGSISPGTAQTVSSGSAATFTITPSSGYRIITPIGGTCPQGTLHDTSYTTGAITANCTVAPTFNLQGQFSNVILNPGFESGPLFWEQNFSNIISNVNASGHNGSNYVAYLGGYNYATDQIYQTVTLPASAASISLDFYHSISTDETTSTTVWDNLYVKVQDVNAGTDPVIITSLSNLDAGSSWSRSNTFDLSAYKGKTINLIFTASTDGSYVTYFFIDDISLDVVPGGTGPYTVTYYGNGNTSGTPPSDSMTYLSGSSVSLLGAGSLVKTGHSFGGWNTAANGSGTSFAANTTFVMGTANVSLYAKWTINNYTVSYNSNGGNLITSQIVPYNSITTAPIPPIRTGHAFAGWYSDSGLTTVFNFNTPIGANITLYAKWTTNSYLLSLTINGDGMVNGMINGVSGLYCDTGTCSAAYIYGTQITLMATPAASSFFSGWGAACSGTDICTFIVDGVKSVNATFSNLSPVRIGGTMPVYVTPHTLQNTYNAAGNGAAIEIMSGVLNAIDTLSANDPSGKSVTLKGGFDATFSSNSSGSTAITGPLTIRRGAVRAEKIKIR